MVGYLIVSEPVNHHPVEKKDQAVKMVDDPLDLNFYLWMVYVFLSSYFISQYLVHSLASSFCFLFLKCLGNISPILVLSNTCVDFKLVCRTAWKTARHPNIILNILTVVWNKGKEQEITKTRNTGCPAKTLLFLEFLGYQGV